MRTAILLSILILLLPLAAFAAISGTVIDEQGAPIPGAAVSAFSSESLAELQERLRGEKPERTPLATAQSGADGAFRLDLARTPVVTLAFSAPGRGVVTFEAADGEEVGAVLLRKTSPRKGRMTMRGKPVANAVIGGRGGSVVRTDANGVFELPEPSAGDRVFAWHPDSGIDELSFRGPSLDLRVEPGITVRGRVVGEDGKPVAHAKLDVAGRLYGQSADDGSFVLQQVFPLWTAIVARAGDRAGLVLRSSKPPYEIRLHPAAFSGTVRDAKTQAPVGGMRLMLWAETETEYALSDGKGNFAFPPLPPAQYRLSASHPAYSLNMAEVELREGKRESRALTATPYARISGTVTDEDRKPVAAATVTPRAGFGSAGTRNAVTNRAGEFTVRAATQGPPPMLEAAKEGYATAQTSVAIAAGETKSGVSIRLTHGTPVKLTVVDGERLPMPEVLVSFFRLASEGGGTFDAVPVAVCDGPGCNTTGASGTLDLRVAPGRYDIRLAGDAIVMKNEPGVVIGAKPQPVTIIVERGVEISGRVVYSDGAPAPDVLVRLARPMQGSTARSDASGGFTLRGVRRGPQTLAAETPMRFAAPPRQVTAPASDVVITIAQPGKVSGRVLDAASQQPLPEFTVAAVRRNAAGPSTPTPFRSDDGAFSIDVPPGSFDLQVMAPGYARGSATGIEVEEGKNIEGVEVKLERGARLAGRVTSGGSPVSGASVRVQDNTSPMMMSDRGQAQAVTDANGDYLLDSLAPGERAISFSKDGFVQQRKSIEVSAAKETRLDIDLVRGRELRGRVVDESGQPIAAAEVRQQIGMYPAYGQNRTDSDGVFRIGNLADTPLTVVVSKAGYIDARAESVDPSAGVTITLKRGGAITGRVTGLTPEELQQTSISAWGQGSSFGSANARPDPNGNFTLQGLPDGSVSVSARVFGTPMRQSPMKSVDVVNGTAAPVEIVFGGGYTVRGRVTRGGKPLTNAFVTFQPADRQNQGFIFAEARSGEYEAAGLSAGAYSIGVRMMNGSSIFKEDLTVAGDARHDIDVRGSSIRGHVVDARTSAPLAEALVFIDASGAQATTDSSGAFVIDVEGDGTVQLRTQRARYQPVTRDVTVTGGQPPPVELQLEPAEASLVRVVDAVNGRPLEAYVSVSDGHQTVFSTTSTADDGIARVFVAPGTYQLTVHSQGYAQMGASLVAPGPEVRVVMTRGGTVVIQSRSGQHVRGRLTRPGLGPIPIFDRALNVPAGSFVLEVLDPASKVAGSYPVVVLDGQTVTVAVD
ncbi:MAG TPA: carboxypeptidase regulatory-like domain-containing protein [Thermoanaerobaculia bacterium]|nr:carboxypeptidase regulatory-like domain-containing protein [Thermoanaerobaculia bacterium]